MQPSDRTVVSNEKYTVVDDGGDEIVMVTPIEVSPIQNVMYLSVYTAR
jgi:hypothetical protein